MAEAELFHNNKRRFDELTKIDENEEIELTLGLSLNGRFGVNPNRPDNALLVRSSSVSSFIFSGNGGEADTEKITKETVSLGRTMSLPAGTEEDWRRRKEAQTIRRMEVRRKRVEKMMSEKLKIGGVRIARNRVVIGERGVPLGNRLGSHQNGSTSKESDSESQITNQDMQESTCIKNFQSIIYGMKITEWGCIGEKKERVRGRIVQ